MAGTESRQCDAFVCQPLQGSLSFGSENNAAEHKRSRQERNRKVTRQRKTYNVVALRSPFRQKQRELAKACGRMTADNTVLLFTGETASGSEDDEAGRKRKRKEKKERKKEKKRRRKLQRQKDEEGEEEEQENGAEEVPAEPDEPERNDLEEAEGDVRPAGPRRTGECDCGLTWRISLASQQMNGSQKTTVTSSDRSLEVLDGPLNIDAPRTLAHLCFRRFDARMCES